MNKSRLNFILALLLSNAFLIFVCRGNFWHLLLALAALPIAVIALLLGLIKILTITRNDHQFDDALAILGIAVFAGSIFISLFIGEALEEADIANAKEYCESLTPILEHYHSETGQYPNDLESLGKLPRPPTILRREQSYYFSDSTNYSFSFSRPSAIWFDGWTYSKSKWHHYD